MTYAVALHLERGLVFAADTRTNAGFDNIAQYKKLQLWRKPGDRVKTNRRDALALARLLRAGELTAVWVPDESHEAMRDLVRARAAAVETLRVHRQHVGAFMLKHGRIYPRKKGWTMRY